MRVFLPLEYVTGFKYLVVKNDPVIGSSMVAASHQPWMSAQYDQLAAAGLDLPVRPSAG